MQTEDLVASAHIRQALIEAAEAGCPHVELVRYDDQFDCYYCPECDIWLEPLCSDPECGYCTKIPLRPSHR